MYKRGVIMTTFEIILITIFFTLFVMFELILGISYISKRFIKKQITYMVYYNSLKPVPSFIADVKKIKFKKDIVYIKSYDIEEKYYRITIIKKKNFIEAIKAYE